MNWTQFLPSHVSQSGAGRSDVGKLSRLVPDGWWGSIHVALFFTLFWGCYGKAKKRRCPRVIICVDHDHGYLSW